MIFFTYKWSRHAFNLLGWSFCFLLRVSFCVHWRISFLYSFLSSVSYFLRYPWTIAYIVVYFILSIMCFILCLVMCALAYSVTCFLLFSVVCLIFTYVFSCPPCPFVCPLYEPLWIHEDMHDCPSTCERVWIERSHTCDSRETIIK